MMVNMTMKRRMKKVWRREDDGEYDDEEENEEGLEGEDDGEYDQENENNIQSVKLKKCKFRDKDTGVDCFVYEICKLFWPFRSTRILPWCCLFPCFCCKRV